MAYKPHDFKVTVTTANGKTFSGEEWLKRRRVFRYEDNKELCDEFAIRTDPTFRAKEKARRHFERVEARRRQLEEERREIDRQVAALTDDKEEGYVHNHNKNG